MSVQSTIRTYSPRVATFRRGHSSRTLWAKHQRMLARETGGASTASGKVTWVQDPVDLRGLPAIGRGVAGAVRGTQPDRALIAKQPR